MSTPEITIREYDPENGALIGVVSAPSFCRVTRGAHSRVKVIDIAFSNVTTVSNLKLGLIGTAEINPLTTETGVIYSDGSSSTGRFGIESSLSFDATKASQPLSRHFLGVNDAGTSANINNVEVGTRTDTISDYIYLDVEVGSSGTGLRNGSYKIFFDYT